MRYRRTIKDDWLNERLAREGYLVSDHPTFSAIMGIAPDCSVSLRFFGNISIGYYFALIIKADCLEWDAFSALSSNSIIVELEASLPSKLLVLFCDNVDSTKFGILDGAGVRLGNSEDLVRSFTEVNEELTLSPGGLKGINRTINDPFQAWTREHLSRYIVFNDVDAFIIQEDGNLLLLELKRPQESVDSWYPYTDDASNYKAGVAMTQASGGAINWLTVAYNEEDENSISIFWITQATKQVVNGYRTIRSVDSIDFSNIHDAVCEKAPFYSTRSRRRHF